MLQMEEMVFSAEAGGKAGELSDYDLLTARDRTYKKNNFTNNFQIPHLHCPKERVLQMLLAAQELNKTHLGWCHWLRQR